VKEAARIVKITGQNAFRIGLNGGKYWRRPKLSNSEVVAPDIHGSERLLVTCNSDIGHLLKLVY